MDTPRYRIGNDLSVFWAIHNRDGSPYNLEGKEVRLFVTHPRGREEVVPVLSTLPDGTINNVIRWDCKGEDQRVLGAYTLTVEILTAEDHKEIKKDICEAFVLVGSSCSECDDDKEINIQDGGVLILSSKLDVYQIGVPKVEIGENGNWFIDGVDTGVSALGGGEGLVNKIYKETDFGGEFDPESVIDTFNAHSINALWLKLKEFAVDSPAVDDVLIYNGLLWVNESFQSLINRYGGTGSGGEGETFWYLGSDGKVHINYDIQIHGNALIEGDTASGGSGEETPAEGTVTSIEVDGTSYIPDSLGVIDLTDAFKNVTAFLSDYYTKEEINSLGFLTSASLSGYAKEIWVNEQIKNIDLSGYATIDELSKYVLLTAASQTITGEVIIDGNLIVKGDVASGGEGEETPAEGTVTRIDVDGIPYNPDSLGVIDLTEAFKNVKVDLSNYYTKYEVNELIDEIKAGDIDLANYYTKEEIDGKGFLTSASLVGYAKTTDVADTYATKAALATLQSSHNTLRSEFDALNDALNDDVSGKINTWNEIVDFVNEYSGSEDLSTILSGMNAEIAKRALQSDFTALATRVGTAEGNITALTNGKADKATTLAGYGITNAYTKGETDLLLGKYVLLEKASQTIKGDITIEGNLVITGDVASGGEGGNTSAEGTVTGVTVSGVDYTSVEAGLLDLTDLMANYALKSASTKVSVSPSLSSGKSIGVISVDGVGTTLYAPATYAWSEISEKPNALLFSGTSSQFLKADGSVDSNAYVLAKAFGDNDANTTYDASMLSLGGGSNLPFSLGYGSLLTMPYRKMTGNTKPDFAAQIFIPNGDATKPYLYYRTSLGNSWNAWRTVLDDGNYSDYALPTSGGTIKDSAGLPLVLNTSSSTSVELRLQIQGSNRVQLGYNTTDGVFIGAPAVGYRLGITTGGTPIFYNGTNRTLYHTGNFNPADYLPLSGGTLYNGVSDTPLYIKSNIGAAYIGFKNSSDALLGYYGFNDTTPTVYIGTSAEYNILHSGNVGNYTMVFDKTHGSYASSSKNNIVGYGHSDDGWFTTGPVFTFGLSNYYGQIQKVNNDNTLYIRSYVNGSYTNWKTIAFTDSDITGYAAGLKHSNGTIGAILNSSGNVLIGDTEDNGYKLDVAGTGRFTDSLLVSGTLTANSGATITGDVTINGNLIVSGDVASGGTGQDTPSEGGEVLGALRLTGYLEGMGENTTQAEMNAIGLTTEVIDNIFNGKYTIIIDNQGNGFSYNTYHSTTNDSGTINLNQGIIGAYGYSFQIKKRTDGYYDIYMMEL